MKCMHQLLGNSEHSSFLTHGSLWWKLSSCSALQCFSFLSPQDIILWFFPVWPTAPSQAPLLFLPFLHNFEMWPCPRTQSSAPCSASTYTPDELTPASELSTLGIGRQLSNVHLWCCPSPELQNHMNNCFLDSHSWASISISEFHIQRPAS